MSTTSSEDFSESVSNVAAANIDAPTQMHKLDTSHAADQMAAEFLNFPPSNPTGLTQLPPGTFPILPLPDSSGSTHPQVPAFPVFPPLDSSMSMWPQALSLPILAQLLPSSGWYDPTAPVFTPGQQISGPRKTKPWDHIGVDVEEARKKIDTNQKAFEERQKKAKEQEERRLAIEGQIKRIEEDRAKLLEALKTKASPQPQATKISNKKQALKDQIAKIEADRTKLLEALKGKDGLMPQVQTNGTQKEMLEQRIRKIEEERMKLLDALRVKGASTPESKPIDNQKQTLEQQISKIEQERTKLLNVLKAKGALSPQEPQKDTAKSERIAALRRQLAEKQAEARALGLIDEEGNDIPDPSPAYRGRGGRSYRGGYVPRGHSYHPYRGPYRGFSDASHVGYRGRGY
jgi:hypothetical protein